jgi:hypothetical protein
MKQQSRDRCGVENQETKSGQFRGSVICCADRFLASEFTVHMAEIFEEEHSGVAPGNSKGISEIWRD